MTDIPGYETIRWDRDRVVMLDQRRLPMAEVYLTCTTYQEIIDAIRTLAIRGAPAIGIAGAMGLALGALQSNAATFAEFYRQLQTIGEAISAARPTAVNLAWAVQRLLQLAAAEASRPVPELKALLVAEAQALLAEDIALNRQMGQLGQELLADGMEVLTHCNAGGLATGGYGTALGVIRAAWERGKKIHVWVDETRPVLQGARLTAWELGKLGIPYTLICDNAAASLMARGRIQAVIVGADRIAANGDVANKIGTYSTAVAAHYHGIPFYVAAPLSTFDFSLASGSQIPIEERDPAEVRNCFGCPVAPPEAPAYNPAFDVTPHVLISGIITEKGICRPPLPEAVVALKS